MVDIGTLLGKLELDDQFSAGLDLAAGKAKGFGTEIQGALGIASVAIGAFTGLVAGAVTGLVMLGQRGSTVDDITSSFKGLTAEMGSFDDVIGALRGSVDGTISDFELMKTTNAALSRGLVLTKDELALTGETARILADRVGIDTAEAFETLTKVMSTGTTKALKGIGFETIDAKAATEAYAASIGKEVKALTDSEKHLAIKTRMLEVMRGELERTGGVEVDFADRVDQVKASVQNFTDEVGVAIATSPVILHLMGEIGEAILGAFGDDKVQAIQTISGYVNTFAIFLVDLGQTALSVAEFMTNAFYGVRAAVMTIFEWIFKGFELITGGLQGIANAGANLNIPGAESIRQSLQETTAVIDAMGNSFGESASDALDAAGSWGATFQAGQKGLGDLRGELTKLAAEGTKPEAITKALQGIPPAAQAIGPDVAKAAKELEKLGEFITKTNLEFGKNEIGQQWAEQIHKNAERVGEAIVSNFQRGHEAMLEFEREQRQATMTETQFKIDEIHRWGQNEINALDKSVAGWEIAQDKINAVVSGRIDRLVVDEIAAQELIFDALDKKAKEAQEKSLKSAVAYGKKLSGVIVGAIQQGGGADRIGGSIGAQLGGDLGSKLGEGLGTKIAEGVGGKVGSALGGIVGGFMGPLGSMAGAWIGKKIGGLFGGGEGKKVNDMRDQFVAAAGGIEALNIQAMKAGVTLDALLKADKVSEFEAAVAQLNGAIQQNAADLQLAKQAAEEFGIPMERMGGAFKQAEQDALSADLLGKIKALGAAGVDMATIIEFAGDDIGAFIHNAIEMGTTVPKELEKIAAQMIENGTLIDKNGEAFTDLSQIPFAQNLNEQFSELMTTMNRFFQDFFDNLRGIPREVNFDINGNVNVNDPNGTLPAGDPIPMAEGGITTGPTLALIGERGREMVLPLDEGFKRFGESGIGEEMSGVKERLDTLNRNFSAYNAQQPTLIALALRDAMRGAG